MKLSYIYLETLTIFILTIIKYSAHFSHFSHIFHENA
jgi:hypothetical protein